jgi:DNA methylase
VILDPSAEDLSDEPSSVIGRHCRATSRHPLFTLSAMERHQEKPCLVTSARFIIGDTREVLRKLPDQSVDLVLSSPPFLALRSYLPGDHPDKGKEIGSEPTPGEFIDTLLDIVEECARVLAPHGSLAFELGDTYSGSGGAGGDYGLGGLRDGQAKFNGSALADRKNKVLRADGNRLQQGAGWPLAKSLCLIPESFRWALVYGRNPFTGRETPPWRARNVVRWVRPNPPVGALGDKFRPATSELVVVCKSDKRYFDLDAVREPHKDGAAAALPHPRSASRATYPGGGGDTDAEDTDRAYGGHRGNPGGAPPKDWWEIPPGGYSGSHYAVFPPELCIRPIKAMCPERVCTVCGKPSERITSDPIYVRNDSDRVPARLAMLDGIRVAEGVDQHHVEAGANTSVTRQTETIGWTDCGHKSWRRGVVLDCFGGSGTTGLVAIGHGRDAILIDIDERNAELARERIGMFLTVEDWR